MKGLPFVIMLLSAGLVALIGYLIRFRRMHGLISGYNTMSEQKKKQVDVEGLGRMFGNAMFVMAGILLASTLLFRFGQDLLGGIALALIVPVTIYLVIAGQKFDGSTRTASGAMRPGSKVLTGFIVVSIIAVVAFVGFLVYRVAQPAAITFENGTLSISGLYGQQIPAADIRRVEMLESLPKVLRRTNGSAIGSQLAGHFTLEGVGAAMLFVKADQPPFIYIETPARKIYLNAGSPEATRQLHAAITAAIPRAAAGAVGPDRPLVSRLTAA